jgi:hypothetical protein
MKAGTMFILNNQLFLTTPHIRGTWHASNPGVFTPVKEANAGLVKPALGVSRCESRKIIQKEAGAFVREDSSCPESNSSGPHAARGQSRELSPTAKRWRLLWPILLILTVGAANYCGSSMDRVRQIREKHQLGQQLRAKELQVQVLQAKQTLREKEYLVQLAAAKAESMDRATQWVKAQSDRSKAAARYAAATPASSPGVGMKSDPVRTQPVSTVSAVWSGGNSGTGRKPGNKI